MMKLVGKIIFEFFPFHFLGSVIASLLLNKKKNEMFQLVDCMFMMVIIAMRILTSNARCVPGALLKALRVVTYLIFVTTP